MVQNVKRASESLYDEFRNYFPFSTVDLLVIFDDKFLIIASGLIMDNVFSIIVFSPL